MHKNSPRANRIAQILERRLGIRVPGADADLFAAGALDSLSFINLLLHLEGEFGIAIPLEQLDLEQFSTVNRIAAFVDEATGEADGFGPGVLSRTA